MPLKLIPPREGRSKNWRIRGTYLGVPVDRSAGTDRRALAGQILKRLERDIERGAVTAPAPQGFAAATVEYLKACPAAEVPRVSRLLEHFGDVAFETIDNAAARDCAKAFYPDGPTTFRSPVNATINREVIGPLAAIVHLAAELGWCAYVRFKRFPEPRGRIRLDEPATIEAFLEALPVMRAPRRRRKRPDLRDREGPTRYPRAAALFLFCTGARSTEMRALPPSRTALNRNHATLVDTKNGDDRGVYLPDRLVAMMREIPIDPGDAPLFGYTRREQLIEDWAEARGKVPEAAGLTPHGARHCWAGWMRQGGADLKALMEFGGWKDAKSVMRYTAVASFEQRAAVDALAISGAPDAAAGCEKDVESDRKAG
ncbi:MAG: tyrosine-type recombinase/integrase [Alphaproteobacteria bacterium]|nr:tyrosine-type recombinase/integrase [Alphaproteobacteria bacterium]